MQTYTTPIMNFYGDSFHATRPGYGFNWSFMPLPDEKALIQVVDTTPRHNNELGIDYHPWQASFQSFKTPVTCAISDRPNGVSADDWPKADCSNINGAAILSQINDPPSMVGFMLLNGRRLGNLGAIEAIPNSAITGFQTAQVTAFGGGDLGKALAGHIVWSNGTRGGIDTVNKTNNKVDCPSMNGNLTNCYIGRFGWIGDRVSLEDQVANAAFVEMNLTSKNAYKKLYEELYHKKDVQFPIRYNLSNCGPADKKCRDPMAGNGDLEEKDIYRMADYARWIGSPTRSEFSVAMTDVIAGEDIFVNTLKCNTCHVISKIEIPSEVDTMLPDFYSKRLKTHISASHKPFLAYLGTDLLLHDMGYLSQIAYTGALSIRDSNGVVIDNPQGKPHNPKSYVQKIRTPALKGLRFNRFVTDSHRNTMSATPPNPACDFLLHDGRACDSIEAAFLHDGPAVKKSDMIKRLSALSKTQLQHLRAFLYSL